MKSLTLWQPWASLISIGAKMIETRSWSTTYRGPLAIHAAKTTKGFDTLPGDCEGTVEGGWRFGYIGDFQAGYCFRTSDEGRRGDTFLVGLEGVTCEMSPPLGAVVAICELVDVVPMIDANMPGIQLQEGQLIVVGSTILALVANDGRGNETMRCIEHQRPYGDYRPGRFGWVLEEITPVDPPAPARGGQQLWEWSPFDGPLPTATSAP